eukprot:TRINITY_DN27258_c0_g1_i1.p1 TRINITY_DN27258_c0_g1~~TRINITY_DN27258_c0_g1_i1.p1  ORF type:complete len:283 (+),score=17.04 TRINITY_DN27258_c0_g1_i1:157-1005(+)
MRRYSLAVALCFLISFASTGCMQNWHKERSFPTSQLLDLQTMKNTALYSTLGPFRGPKNRVLVHASSTTAILQNIHQPLVIRMGYSARANLYWYKTCEFINATQVPPLNPAIRRTARAVCKHIASTSPNFVFVHVRRGDLVYPALSCNWPRLDNDTQGGAIRTRLLQWYPKGTGIFLASDEHRPHFFDALEPTFTVYRPSDFPELRAIQNSYLLFATEMAVAECAMDVVQTFRHESWLFELRRESKFFLTAEERVVGDTPCYDWHPGTTGRRPSRHTPRYLL